ncbi:MAG TPA: hypothetical protein VN795_03585, partial [Stellaceae bacterium]|nr:hypothetical protein [Stellaceae bacterium]
MSWTNHGVHFSPDTLRRFTAGPKQFLATPAKAGVREKLDSRFRGNDGKTILMPDGSIGLRLLLVGVGRHLHTEDLLGIGHHAAAGR